MTMLVQNQYNYYYYKHEELFLFHVIMYYNYYLGKKPRQCLQKKKFEPCFLRIAMQSVVQSVQQNLPTARHVLLYT